MKKIQIPEKGEFKFILVKKGKSYCIFGDFLPYHTDLLDNFLQLNSGNFDVQGGGKISVEDKIIKVYGKSEHYGLFDKKTVKEIMEKYCKRKGLKLEIE